MNLKKWRNFLIDEEEQKPQYNPNLSLLTENIFDDLDLTHLSEGQLRLLMEGRKDNVLKKYGDLIDEEVMETIINFDEQYGYKHLNWMARQLAKTDDAGRAYTYEQNEHVDTLVAAISDFVRYKQAMKQKAIEQYDDVEDLLNAIHKDAIEPRIEKARKKRDSNPVAKKLFNAGEGSNIYEDERYYVVRPDSPEASCHFGKNTKWCISQHGNSYFSQYTNSEGKVFYFIKDDTKKNDDKGYKMAVEISQQSNEIYINTVWDRFDDPAEVESEYPGDLANTLRNEFDMPEDTAERIAEEIIMHARENPPDSPLAEMHEKIENGDWDGGFVTINSYYEDYDEHPYLMITADVQMVYKIKNEKLIKMLDNGEIDISEAEEKLIEAFEGEGVMYEALDDAVDIGASKWWWPNEDNRDDPIAVDISTPGKTADSDERVWEIKITIGPFEDTDYGGTYTTSSMDEAESFCNYMQEEWGERNEMEIMEVLENNLVRHIPEVGIAQADKWKEIRNQFVNGQYELIPGAMWYDVDDDDDEASDLNLHMSFTYELNPEFTRIVFNAKEITNTAGNKVIVAQKNITAAAAAMNRFFIRGGGPKGYLERAVYNVYQQALDFAEKQLKLDFGPGFDLDDELELPTVPEDISTNVSFSKDTLRRFQGSDNIIPDPAHVDILLSIYIPFHKSETELQSLMNLFLFIRDRHDQINSYIRKYIKDYASADINVSTFPVPGGAGTVEKRHIKAIKENMYMDILESQMFLEALGEELKEYKRRKFRK